MTTTIGLVSVWFDSNIRFHPFTLGCEGAQGRCEIAYFSRLYTAVDESTMANGSRGGD